MKSSGEIADRLSLLARLMELHGENPFKTRAYSNAAFRLSKLRYDFAGKTIEDIERIEGLGKGLAAKVFHLASTGDMPELNEFLSRTPEGVVEMLRIKGLGPKKVQQLWRELCCESVGELLYACHENRLVGLRGFGEKTQQQVLQNIEFSLEGRNKVHYAAVESAVNAILETLKDQGIQAAVTGEMARKNPVIEKIQLLVSASPPSEMGPVEKMSPLPVGYVVCEPGHFWRRSVELSATPDHLRQIGFEKLGTSGFSGEEQVYEKLGLQFVPPELREGLGEVELARQHRLPTLIEPGDLKGILHCHTTYSDGADSLEEMAIYCRDLGYHYFGVCDHSRSAVYAGGLSVDRVMEQHREIEALNGRLSPFRILKGIESDILGDGSLDYPDEVLATFDFVVASVHQNLKMTEEKATARLLRAIENPYTSILGHPTGRLLLGRPGYPIDHRKVIDACAANGVSIELNAHPYRLDIDWQWIPYCIGKGVKISINPDAHHKPGILDVRYGVLAARKGMLSVENCLNAASLHQLLSFFSRR